MTVRISQITDLHINPEDTPCRGVDTREQLRRVLAAINENPPDYLVLSGDLALNKGEKPAYEWLKSELDQNVSYPYFIMMGNHDVLATLKQVFPLEAHIQNDMLYYDYCVNNGQHLLFLDSTPYRVHPIQLEWLATIATQTCRDALLFIHHPPILCGNMFMDSRYYMQNHQVVWQQIKQLPAIRHVFCGHYHTGCDINLDGKWVHLTPATLWQIDTTAPEFNIETKQAGWRSIEWHEDGQVNTQWHYLAN